MTTIVVVVVILLVALAVAIATRPDTFRVERTVVAEAPADVLFGYVNDFHEWPRWSPFEELDPNLKRTYTGAPAGVGAAYGWAGNAKAGEGKMVITESVPNERIALDLQFTRPFKAENVAEFTFRRVPEGSAVTWATSGKNTVAGKVIALFSSMDRLIGKDFEKGLAKLKGLSETEARRRAAEGGTGNATLASLT